MSGMGQGGEAVKRKPKAKFRVGQVVYNKAANRYEQVLSASYPYKSIDGYFVINWQTEAHFRPLTARERGERKGGK